MTLAVCTGSSAFTAIVWPVFRSLAKTETLPVMLGGDLFYLFQ